MATNYSRGRSFEYRTRDALKKRGAAYVMRAAQSKGAVDLLALWSWQEVWLIQCKYSIKGGGYLPEREEIELLALSEATGGHLPVLARPGKNGRGVEFINLTTKEPIG